MAEIPTIAEAAQLIATKKLSPVELTRACLDRVERLDGTLHAFLRLLPERALAEAKAAEAAIMKGERKGPLHGIPIAHKDIYSTRGIPTTCHSKVLAEHVPEADATVVQRLAAAGTVMLGKLATHEFAWGGPSFDLPWPPARNPWDPGRFTGGSSSGTGAAVAAGLVLGGTGSDTGGSIRLPAAFCGITGLKPTYGLVPRTGIFPLAWSLDHAGPLAWTVEDCAILLQAMAGHDPLDPASVALPLPDYRGALSGTIKGLRIGLVRHFHEEDNPPLDPALKRAIDAAMAVFRGLGAEVRDVRLPPLADWASAALLIMMSEAWAVHEPWLKARPLDYGEIHRDRVTLGAFVSAADYLAAQRLRRELGQRFAEAMQEVDLLVAAVTPGEAPNIEAVTKWSSFERPSLTSPINLLGAPALALRCGFGENGLPLGLQIVGRPFEDALVLHAGHHYEKATQWAAKRPPLAGG